MCSSLTRRPAAAIVAAILAHISRDLEKTIIGIHRPREDHVDEAADRSAVLDELGYHRHLRNQSTAPTTCGGLVLRSPQRIRESGSPERAVAWGITDDKLRHHLLARGDVVALADV